mmetsp:Transcript_20758/g.41527  ORF Transcript_20758/g.41527 Transcript_20758/m.41527 type:complete len:238 (-) Transcript_20758:476-1189(-)
MKSRMLPSMTKFTDHQPPEPQRIPMGENAPPPLRRFRVRIRTKRVERAYTLGRDTTLSSSRILRSSGSSGAEGAGSSVSRSPSPSPSPSRTISASSLAASTALSPLFLISAFSFLYIFTAFFRLLLAVMPSRSTRSTAKTSSGRILLTMAPARAPAIVTGSMTRIRSQSTHGLSAFGCLLGKLSMKLAREPPKTVTLDRGMACFGSKPRTRVYRGTRMPPPPIPPPAARRRPRVDNK